MTGNMTEMLLICHPRAGGDLSLMWRSANVMDTENKSRHDETSLKLAQNENGLLQIH